MANDFIGAAPRADIAVVKLKPAKEYLRQFYLIRDGVPAYQENDIMAGVSFLFRLSQHLGKRYPSVLVLAPIPAITAAVPISAVSLIWPEPWPVCALPVPGATRPAGAAITLAGWRMPWNTQR